MDPFGNLTHGKEGLEIILDLPINALAAFLLVVMFPDSTQNGNSCGKLSRLSACRVSRGMHVSATQAREVNIRILNTDQRDNHTLAQAFNSSLIHIVCIS